MNASRWTHYLCLLVLAGVAGPAAAQRPFTPVSLGLDPAAPTAMETANQSHAHPPAYAPSDCSYCDEDVCCCCVPEPVWSVYAGAIILNRSNPDGDPLYQDNVDPLFGSDFDLGWQGGYELEFKRHNITGNDALVARLLVVDGWSAQANALIPTDTQINTNPNIPMVGPRAISSNLNSEFLSFELNYVWESCWHPAVQWMIGFRALEIDESLSTSLVYPPGGFPTVYHMVGTRNRLYGVQTGTDIRFYEGSRFTLRGILSAGIYGNAARHQSFFWDDFTPPIYANGDDSTASLVGETGLSASYAFLDGLSVRVDYRAIWASGLALAPEQIPVTNFTLGNGIDNDATAFYHGVFVGLDWTF